MITTYGLTRYAAPVSLPLTLSRVKNHLKIDDDITTDDALIMGLIRTATSHAETVTRRALITQTWDLTLDRFPCWEIELPKPNLQSISSITYIDENGNTQTLSSSLYLVDTKQTPGRVTPSYGQTWPTTQDRINAVTIRFVAGYGDNPATVPEEIRSAMLLMIGHWYENRQATAAGVTITDLPMGADALLAPFRVITF